MDNLFEKQTAQKYIARLNSLTPESKAQWGKMNVGQMVKHCQASFNIASGDLKIKTPFLVRFLFGKSARKQILQDPQFKKNLPTFTEAKTTDLRVLDEERNKLVALIEKHQAGGEAKITKETHSFFGDLTMEEWNALLVKHLDHHLRQFGA